MELDVQRDAEGSYDDGDDLDDCLAGWGDGGVSESRCEVDETITDALSSALDKGNDVTHGNDNGSGSSDKSRRCMFETLTSDPLQNGIESIEVAHSAVDEDGQRYEGMRGILQGPVENGNENVVSVNTPCDEEETPASAHGDYAVEEAEVRHGGYDVDGGRHEEMRGILTNVYGACKDNQDGLKCYTPDPCMVARHGPYVPCAEVPCKAIFLGRPCKMEMMLPTEGTIYKEHQCKRCNNFYHSMCVGEPPHFLVCIISRCYHHCPSAPLPS